MCPLHGHMVLTHNILLPHGPCACMDSKVVWKDICSDHNCPQPWRGVISVSWCFLGLLPGRHQNVGWNWNDIIKQTLWRLMAHNHIHWCLHWCLNTFYRLITHSWLTYAIKSMFDSLFLDWSNGILMINIFNGPYGVDTVKIFYMCHGQNMF